MQKDQRSLNTTTVTKNELKEIVLLAAVLDPVEYSRELCRHTTLSTTM